MPIDYKNFYDNIINKTQFKHGCYRLVDFDQIPHNPGIYSWYLIADQINFDDYFKIFKQKKVGVNVEGELREAYTGEAKATYNVSDYSDNPVDFTLFNLISYIYSPPLYIGISINLNERLNTHKSELEKILSGKQKLTTSTIPGRTSFDDILESKHFAQRVGFSIKAHNNIGTASMYIKTIEAPLGYPRNNLLKIEKYFNRTYTPIYGRK